MTQIKTRDMLILKTKTIKTYHFNCYQMIYLSMLQKFILNFKIF